LAFLPDAAVALPRRTGGLRTASEGRHWLRRSTSREAAEYGSQGQARSARPWIVLDKIPRPEGAQYSVARFAGSVIRGHAIPGLRSLRSLSRGYLLPPLRGSLKRDIRVHSFVWFVLSGRAQSGKALQLTAR